MKAFKNGVFSYSIIFTFATIISSVYQLIIGQITDTNYHILNRAVICLIGVSLIYIEKYFKFKNKILNIIIPYICSMTLIYFYVWLTSFVDPLHPDAYIGITLNFTALYVIVYLTLFFIRRKKNLGKS